MASWKMTVALAVAGVMLAGPAFAQATTGSAGQMPRASATTSATMKSDTGMKSGISRKSRSARSGGKDVMAMAGDEKVKAVQQALKDKGHHPGTVDGRMGPKTQQALRDFQKAHGMQATGELDAKTMHSLGVEVSTTSSAESTGSASPASGSTTDTLKK
jgi:peptidoglycan hydrolase-like protein with peptidoglycan-binding domain